MSAADQHKEKIVCMLDNISDEKFLNQIRIVLKRHIERGSESMNEEQFYKDGISKMLSTIHNVNWLLKIYSFIKVFFDDVEGGA